MSEESMHRISLAQQAAITARSHHPNGEYIPFDAAERDGSMFVRWARMLRLFADRPALHDGDLRLTYAEVDALTDRWARAIIAYQGPGANAVGLVFSLEADLPLAALAVWKAGKYYVWIEREQPAARSQLILEDAGIDLILTNAGAMPFVVAMAAPSTTVVKLDSRRDLGFAEMADTDGQIPLPVVPREAIAYIIYTSGTTGRPKGVVENHGNLVHSTIVRSDYVHVCAEDRITMSVAGGGLLFSIMVAWLNGALLLPFRFRAEGLVRFNAWIVEHGITILHGGAVLRTWLLLLDGSQTFPSVRLLAGGGAPFYREHLVAMQRYLPEQCALMNMYSASEGRNFCQLLLDRVTELTGRLLPVGYASSGVEVQVWDDAGNVLPAGEVGELVIVSPYLADGYWRLPELTAARFGQDETGRRTYRTGDLGRVEADGLVWVLGRRDDQVKIRGFRVETAEVEVVLLDAPEVREAAVLAEGDDDSSRRLVAFVGVGPEAAQNVELAQTLRRRLAVQLPDYMIPREIYVSAELPHNHLRKIDRAQLRAQLVHEAKPQHRRSVALFSAGEMSPPDEARVREHLPGTDGVAPVTATERQVAEMVGELLQRANIGRDENFFEIGGHSLLAARLMLRIHRQWGIDLPPRHFFAQPTVAALASAIEAAQNTDPTLLDAPLGIHAVRVVDGAAGRLPFFLMAGGGGSTVELLWYRDFIQDLGADQPVYALLAHGPLGRGAIYASVGEMVVDAIAAVRRVQPKGPYLLGGECIGGKLAYEMARILEQEGEEVALCVLLDTALPDANTQASAPTARRWWRRMRYHWIHVQRLGWHAGAAHVVDLVGRVLPPRVYHNPQTRTAQAVRDAYRQLLSDYRPAERYNRRIVVILSAETQSRHPAWQSLAAEVEEYVVEGTHQTYLSVAAHQAAAQVRVHLRRAQGLPAAEAGL